MSTFAIDLPEDMKSFVDQKISTGEFPNASAVVQRLIADAMDSEWRAEVEKKLLQAIKEDEKGLGIPWTKERQEELLKEHQERMAKKRASR